MSANMGTLPARMKRFLSQDIDIKGIWAGLKTKLTGLVRRVVLPPLPAPGAEETQTLRMSGNGTATIKTALPLAHQDSSSVVLMAVPAATIHSFELDMAPVTGISDAKLIDNNFEVHAPFRRDAVFGAFRRANDKLEVRYVPRKSVEPLLAQWRNLGQEIDGLTLDPQGTFVVLFDRKVLAMRLMRANRTAMLGLCAIILALCVMSQVLGRQHRTKEMLNDTLVRLLAERRSMERPGNAQLDAALRAEVLAEAGHMLACLRVNLPPDAAVAALAIQDGGTRLRVSPPEAGEMLGTACRRAVEREAGAALLLRRQERAP